MEPDKTRLDFSSNESAILGLKVGRCNAELFNQSELADQIISGKYDICRLKIPAEDEDVSLKLHQTGFPFFFSGSIRRYKTGISTYPQGEYYHPEMVYEMYDGSQDALLREMINGTWGTYPVGYYRTPWLSSLITKEAEIECLFRFYKKHNLNSDYPQNAIMFMKDGDKYIGFFALNIVDGNLESHIGGILAPYRKGGYFLDMLRYIKIYCVDHQLTHFLFGARNENAEVQRIFQEVGFKATGSENVFHIPSLLSYSALPPVIVPLDIASNDSAGMMGEIFPQLVAHTNKWVNLSGQSWDHKWILNDLQKGRYKLEIRFPLQSEKESLLVYLLTRQDDQNAAFGYFSVRNC